MHMNMYIYVYIYNIYIYIYIYTNMCKYMCYIEQEACDYIRVAHVHLNSKTWSYFRNRALPKQGTVFKRDRAQQFETELPRHARSACPTKGVKSLSTPRHLVILRTLFVTLQLPHVWFSCVTSINACHTYEWFMSHIHFKHVVTRMNESCHIYDWGISHRLLSHVMHINTSRHTSESAISQIMNESCHTYDWAMLIWPNTNGHAPKIMEDLL